jgi:hypothetical protein
VSMGDEGLVAAWAPVLGARYRVTGALQGARELRRTLEPAVSRFFKEPNPVPIKQWLRRPVPFQSVNRNVRNTSGRDDQLTA